MKKKIQSDDDVLFKIFGANIHTRVITFLFHNRDFFGTQSDIARALNLSNASVKRVVDDLAEFKIVKKLKIGPSILIQFDFEGSLTRALLEFLDGIHQSREVNRVEIKR